MIQTKINNKIVRKLLCAAALLLCAALMLPAAGAHFAPPAQAEEFKELVIAGDTLAPGNHSYQRRAEVSYVPGGKSFELNHNNREFVLLPAQPWDVSSFDSDKLAITLWVFMLRPIGSLHGDNQIEISSVTSSAHDTNEFSWPATHIFFNLDYKAGQWNKMLLKIERDQAPNVDLSELRWFRFYYTSDVSGIFLADIRIVETDKTHSQILETRAPLSPIVDEVEGVPTTGKEGVSMTLPPATARDANGNAISPSLINIRTTGPGNYDVRGNTVNFSAGEGIYTVTYTAFDSIGVGASRSYTIAAEGSLTDNLAPVIMFSSGYMTETKLGANVDFSAGVSITDNKGRDNIRITAQVTDSKGQTVASYSGRLVNLTNQLLIAPATPGDYTVSFTATDDSGNSSSAQRTVGSYSDPSSSNYVTLFDFEGGDYSFSRGAQYLSDVVNAAPEGSAYSRSLMFDYPGGAENLSDNATYYRGSVVTNNNLPSFDAVDIKWAAISMWLYIDKEYDNDSAWMPSNGGGFGNLGIGFAHKAVLYNSPRLEYNLNVVDLNVGWNKILFKLGRSWDDGIEPVDYTSLSTMYIHTNFGAQRRILIHDVRLVETDEFERGLAREGTVVEQRLPAPEVTLKTDSSGDYAFPEKGYRYSAVHLPGIIATDAHGLVNKLTPGRLITRDSQGQVYTGNVIYPENMGTCTVEYTVTDIYGRTEVLNLQFEVLAENPVPYIEDADAFEERLAAGRYRGVAFAVPQFSPKDDGGEQVSVQLYLISPDGHTAQVEGGTITPRMSGINRLKVVLTDEAGQKAIEFYEFNVFYEVKSVTAFYNPSKFVPHILIAGGVVLIAGAAAAVLIIRKRKVKANSQADS